MGKNLIASIAFIACATCISSSATAQFGGLGSALGSVTGRGAAPDLGRNLTEINIRFAAAMREMLLAQAQTLDALGDKQKADQLISEAKSLEGQNDIGKIKADIQVSQDASKEAQDRMSSAMPLNAEAKAKLVEAMPHYALGIAGASKLPGDYSTWVSSARAAGGNPIAAAGFAMQIPAVADVTAQLPNLISTWSSSTKNFVEFAKGNAVDTKDLASKI